MNTQPSLKHLTRVDVPAGEVVQASNDQTDFVVHARLTDVASYGREGGDLVLTMSDGSTYRIDGFFSHGLNFNNLLFVDGDHELYADFSALMPPGSDAHLLAAGAATAGDTDTGLLPILAGIAVAAVAMEAAGHSSSSSSTTPPTVGTATFTSFVDSAGAITGTFLSGSSTDDRRPLLQGSSSGLAGTDTVYILDGNAVLGTATVNIDGTWSYQVTSDLSEGTHSFIAIVLDANGNEGAPSAPFNLIVDVTPPTTNNAVAITSYVDEAGAITGTFGHDTVTDDTQPLLQGTVSGLEPGGMVLIYADGTLLGTATVNDDGTWSYQVGSDLSEGIHTFTAVIADAVGNPGTTSDPFNLWVDITPPTTNNAVEISAYFDHVGASTGTMGEGSTTDDPRPLLQGSVSGLEPGGMVFIYEDGTLLGTATVAVDGSTWSYRIASDLGEGAHSFTAVIADAAGNPGTASDPFTLTVDLSGPSAGNAVEITSYHDSVGTLIGNFGTDTSTDDPQPLLQGTVSGLQSGDTVRIYDDTGTLLGSAEVNTDGTWSYQITSDLSEGAHTFMAVIADASGANGTVSDPFTLTVDITPPIDNNAVAILSYFDNVGSITGTFGSDTTTDDLQPLLQGSVNGLLPGDVVRIYEDGVLLGNASVAVGGGSWNFRVASDLSEGAHTFTAVIADAAGNEGTASDPFTLTVDITPPIANNAVAITAYFNHFDTSTGSFGASATTADPQPLLQGTVSGLAPGDMVRIYDENGSLLGTATVAVGGDTWSFHVTSSLSNGAHSFTAVIADAAGNDGTASDPAALTVSLSSSSPSSAVEITNYHDTVGSIVGNFGPDTTTDDTQPLLQGTVSGLPSGYMVGVFDSTDTITLLGTAMVNTDGTWSYQIASDLSEGAHTFIATVSDTTGALVTASSPFTLTVDLTPPTENNAVAITGYVDNVGAVTGTFGDGTTTDDTQPLLQGTVNGLEHGDMVRIYDDTGTMLGTATVAVGGGTWSFHVAHDLGDGAHSFTAVIADAAGNEGTASTPFALTVDVPVTVSGPFDVGLTSQTLNLLAGHAETLTFNLHDPAHATGGNGVDVVNGFTVGPTETEPNATTLDLSALLIGYTPASPDGPAQYVGGVPTITPGDHIGDYLNVTHDGGNTTINLDRDGSADAFSSTALVTLQGVNVSLETLLANHQIVV